MDLSEDALVQVFQALDTENKGYITIDQFISTFSEYYASSAPEGRRLSTTASDIKQIVNALDRTNNGVIYLRDFKKIFADEKNEQMSHEFETSIDPNRGHPHRTSSDVSDYGGEDSGVHLPESSALDPDNASVLSTDAEQLPVLRRTEIRSSWPKREASNPLSFGASSHLRTEQDSPGSASRSDILIDDVETSFERIRDQMRQMEARVEDLQSTHKTEVESRSERLREENARLTAQVTVLEERLKEAEARANRGIEAERQHLQTMMTRATREHDAEVETLRGRISGLEAECGDLRMERSKLKAESQATVLEMRRNTEALTEAQEQLRGLQQELDNKEERFAREMDLLRKDRDHAVRVLEELNGSMSGGKRRSVAAAHPPSPGALAAATESSEVLARYNEVQEIVRRLIQENKALRQQLEEAQDELLNLSLQDGRTLVKSSEKSWAAEIDNCTKEEVVELLTKEKFANNQLREYINSLITRIIERHPSLLEIASG